MIETSIALLLAHVLADFVFQLDWIAQNKRKPQAMALHLAIVAVLSALALGGQWQLVLGITVLHLIIDTVKTFALPDSLLSFFADQITHVVSIIALAVVFPEAFATGLWAQWSDLFIPFALFVIGAVVTIQTGRYAIGYLMARFDVPELGQGLDNAGRLIGQLERGLIFLMVFVEQPAGIGFLIAAKSVLRFDATQDNKKASEYVIIGTLASFGWAIAAAYATKYALLHLAAT